MEKIALFDTSISTLNKGDEIIMESAKNELKSILNGKYVVTVPTHTPAFHWYQTFKRNNLSKALMNINYKFVCGTNLLSTNMFRPWSTWNINFFNIKPLKGAILFGVGSGKNSSKINYYTKKLYQSVLSDKYIHSVRDEETKKIIENLGFKAINTGCPTLWSLTDEFCKLIPTKKSNNVVFTLTDYSQDEIRDQELINILRRNYKTVYYWPQGFFDLDYFKKFRNIEGIKIVSPSLEDFSALLNIGDIDYIGTRLHAGIFSLKHKVRSIIITVDHRAREMNKSYNLNCIERDSIQELPDLINQNFETKVNINVSRINEWKSQFLK